MIDGELFISKRFDIDSDGSALGFEYFCVLQAKSTKQKYDASLESCINTIKQYVSPEYLSQALADFFKLTVINVVIKNDSMALTLTGSKRWPKWKVLEQFAITHCGLSKKKANQILADVYQGANETLPILQKLKSQHKGFSELAEELENLLKRVLS